MGFGEHLRVGRTWGRRENVMVETGRVAREDANGVAITGVRTQSEVCLLAGADYKAPSGKQASPWRAGIHMWSLLHVQLMGTEPARSRVPAKLCVSD